MNDFKPASVDTTREATFEVGEGPQVSVTVPHVQGSGTSHTVYKGNQKPCPKECVLIIDHDTGTFTLEKLTNSIQLKKTRIEGSSRAQQGQQRPLTPVEVAKRSTSPSRQKMNQRSPSSMKGSSPVSSQQDMDIVQPDPMDTCTTVIGEISSSSEDSSSEDSDSDNEAPAPQPPAASDSSESLVVSLSEEPFGRKSLSDPLSSDNSWSKFERPAKS